MGLTTAAGRALARYLRWRNPFQKGAQEATDQYLGKHSKAATLTELILTRDLAEIAEADREGVTALRNKYGFGKKRGGFMGLFGGNKGDDKDIIACDDMTINTGRSNLLDLAVIALIAFLAWKYLGGKLPSAGATATATATAPAAEAQPATAAADLIFYVDNGDGTVSQTKIEPLPPALKGKIVPAK